MSMTAPVAGLPERRAVASGFLCIAMLLQGCSGMWPLRDRPGVPVLSKDVPVAAVVTPTTRSAAVSSPSGPSLHSDVPILLTVPAAKVARKAAPPVPVASKPALPVWGGAADSSPPAGSLLPPGMFGKQAADVASASTAAQPVVPATLPGATPPSASVGAVPPSVSFAVSPVSPTAIPVAGIPVSVTQAKQAQVLLYASPTTRSYFAALGIDYQRNIETWENFLRRHDFRFEIVSSLDRLSKSPSDVLLLPSAVALADSEKQAVAAFRNSGGSVLASWLTGVRGEFGEWRGFAFMETTLNTKVVGNSEEDSDDSFLMPHGDNPVTHRVPAGLRVWVERAQEWFPLRLSGAHSAAEVMDWSRSVRSGKSSSVIAFDERIASTGKPSRAVVLGYPERLWLSADSNAIEPIAHDALTWLAREPDAYAAAWPWPYRSALVLAIDVADTLTDTDLRYAKLAEELGGHATYYVVTEQAANSAQILKDIQSRGHEIAYLGDRFVAFKDQPASMQGRRLDAMVVEMKAAGIDPGVPAGFHAPMDGYDAVTERLLRERGFAHHVSDPGSSEARLPFIAPGSKAAKPLVNLPRTQNGPDDAMAEGDPVAALKGFLDEFDLAEEMAGLNVIRIPSQSILTDAQWADVSKRIKAKSKRMWTATAGQIADWWREHERVRVSLDTEVTPPLLTVFVSGEGPLRQPVTVLANLPEAASVLRLVSDAGGTSAPKVAVFDAWRAAVILEGLAPGAHRWFLSFDRAAGVRQ